MVLDLCLALPLLCQHSHNIGHRQVLSAWPIKAHRKEDTIFFSDASITHVQRAGKIMEHGGRAACQGKVIHLNPANASTISIFEVPSRSSQVKLVARPKQQWIAILHHSEVGPPDVWSQHVTADWGARGSFPRKTRSPWFIYTSFLFKEWEPPFRLCVFQLWAGLLQVEVSRRNDT